MERDAEPMICARCQQRITRDQPTDPFGSVLRHQTCPR